MHHFRARQLASRDLSGGKARDAPREFVSVQVTDADDFAGAELAFAIAHPGWQKALAALAPRPFRAFVDAQCAARMMKERDPTLPSFQTMHLRHKQGPFVLTVENP